MIKYGIYTKFRLKKYEVTLYNLLLCYFKKTALSNGNVSIIGLKELIKVEIAIKKHAPFFELNAGDNPDEE